MSWEKHLLGDYIQIKKGKSITKNTSRDGNYPVILGGREPAYYIDQYNHIGKAIVVSRSGASAGYVSFWNEPIFVTDGFLIEPTTEIDHDFLYYLMKFHEGELQGLQGGSAIPHVTPHIINNISVLIPDKGTQQKIAGLCLAYDNLIENNKKQIKLLEEAAQRLYKEWFVDLRFPGHENTKIVDGVPEGWMYTNVQEMAQVLRRGISPRYSDVGKSIVINQKCIRQSIMDITEARRQEKSYPVELNLQDNDVVICSTGAGTLGRVGQVFGTYPNTTFDSHVTLVRGNCLIGRQLLYHAIKSKQAYLMGRGKGSTNQLELSRSVIQELPILLPSSEIMGCFEAFAQSCHDKICVLNQQNKHLKETRDRFLPKLMNKEIK